jgi:hypothetical protein
MVSIFRAKEIYGEAVQTLLQILLEFLQRLLLLVRE